MTDTSPSRIRCLAATVVGLAALAACSSGSSPAADGASSSPSASSTSTSTSSPETRGRTGLRGERYCEVLLLHPAPAGITADVYNTYPLNDCPESQWAALDAAAIAQENSMLVALLNGPRSWLMDAVEQVDTGPQTHKTFGGIEMIQRATVVVGNPIEASQPYRLNSVDRKAKFTFDRGTTVYELTAADGAKFVMQSWSQQVDPTLDEAGLAQLGTRLELPAGWSYSPRKLSTPLRVDTTATTATVLQDEFRNSYSMEAG